MGLRLQSDQGCSLGRSQLGWRVLAGNAAQLTQLLSLEMSLKASVYRLGTAATWSQKDSEWCAQREFARQGALGIGNSQKVRPVQGGHARACRTARVGTVLAQVG